MELESDDQQRKVVDAQDEGQYKGSMDLSSILRQTECFRLSRGEGGGRILGKNTLLVKSLTINPLKGRRTVSPPANFEKTNRCFPANSFVHLLLA